MFDKDPKKAAMMIIEKHKPDEKMEGGEGPGEELKTAAEDILHAFEKKDAGMLADALKSFCMMADDDSEY